MKKFYSKPFRWQKGIQKAGMVALIMFGGFGAINAQVSDYVFSQNSGTFTSVATTGTLVAGSDATATTTYDSGGWDITIPFTFNFNGVNYTNIYVNANGGATFGTTTSTSSAVISASTAYDGAIGVMNRDLWGAFVTSGVTTSGSNIITNVAAFDGLEVGKLLNTANGIPAGATVTAFDPAAGTITMSANATSSSTAANVRWGSGKVVTAVEGTAPNRTFVIEWYGYNDYSTTASGSNFLNFQLRLAETTNVVSTAYGPSNITATTARTNQIGLRGNTNADFNNRMNTISDPWTATTAGTANNSTVSRNNTVYPPAGLTFIWTPPSCVAPGGVNSTAQTPNSITLSWTASPSTVGNGYTVYYNTTGVPPTSTTVLDPTNSQTVMGTTATFTGLNPGTVYYFWVRANCATNDISQWSAMMGQSTNCLPPTVATTGQTVCSGYSATLNAASTSAGATFEWFDAATGGTSLGTGASYTTPVLTTTTDYWVTASTGTTASVGKTAIESGASGTGGSASSYINFTAHSDFILQTVDIFPYSSTDGTAGTITIELRTATGTAITSTTVNVIGHNTTATSVPQTVTLNFPITGGQSYRLGVSAWTGVSNMFRDNSNLNYPYSLPGVVDITSSSLAGYYYFFYNWQVSSKCESARTLATATVNSDPSCSMATVEADAKNSVSVYPNPFTDVLNIADAEDVASVTVTDMAGRTVKVFGKATEELHLAELRAGMYIITLKMKDGSSKAVKAIKR